MPHLPPAVGIRTPISPHTPHLHPPNLLYIPTRSCATPTFPTLHVPNACTCTPHSCRCSTPNPLHPPDVSTSSGSAFAPRLANVGHCILCACHGGGALSPGFCYAINTGMCTCSSYLTQCGTGCPQYPHTTHARDTAQARSASPTSGRRALPPNSINTSTCTGSRGLSRHG